MSAPLREYRWWPDYHPALAELDGRRVFWPTAIAEGLFVAILALPLVQRATGVPAAWLVGLYVTHCLIGWMNSFVLHPASRSSRRAFHALLLSDLWFNVQGCITLAVVSGDPKSVFWLGLFVYAAARGSSRDLEPSLGYALTLLGAPWVAVPFFLDQGHGIASSIAPPAVVGMFAAFCYHILAGNAAAWRAEREAKSAALELLRVRTAELEREQLARDLHDSVGSALAASRLYADIIERQLDDPERLRRIALTLRDTAQGGLTDLRGVLDALTPEGGDVASLAGTLEQIGRRFSQVSAATVEVVLLGDPHQAASGAVRIALVRIFQEALNNAIRHGHAGTIRARLQAREGHVRLEVEDDGRGFDPDDVRHGRGLEGMRQRAAQLGGSFELRAAREQGVRLSVSMPALWAPADDERSGAEATFPAPAPAIPLRGSPFGGAVTKP